MQLALVLAINSKNLNGVESVTYEGIPVLVEATISIGIHVIKVIV